MRTGKGNGIIVGLGRIVCAGFVNGWYHVTNRGLERQVTDNIPSGQGVPEYELNV
jgi:hypothetical protein